VYVCPLSQFPCAQPSYRTLLPYYAHFGDISLQRTGAVEAYEFRKSPNLTILRAEGTQGPSLCNEMSPKYE
jgi:hypothetical protein